MTWYFPNCEIIEVNEKIGRATFSRINDLSENCKLYFSSRYIACSILHEQCFVKKARVTYIIVLINFQLSKTKKHFINIGSFLHFDKMFKKWIIRLIRICSLKLISIVQKCIQSFF